MASCILNFDICFQELVNLCLTGNAVSNVFDGIMELDSGGTSKVRSYFDGLKFVVKAQCLLAMGTLEGVRNGRNFRLRRWPGSQCETDSTI